MTDLPMPVHFRDAKTDSIPGFLSRFGILRGPHLFERCRCEDRTVRAAPSSEQCTHEAPKVVVGCVHTPGGRYAHLKSWRFEDAAVNRPHVGLRQVLRHLGRLFETAVR